MNRPQSNRRVGALKRLKVDFELVKVFLEVHPRNNRPDHIMRGTPMKSWLHYVLHVGEESFEGSDFDLLVDKAYGFFNKENPLKDLR